MSYCFVDMIFPLMVLGCLTLTLSFRKIIDKFHLSTLVMIICEFFQSNSIFSISDEDSDIQNKLICHFRM